LQIFSLTHEQLLWAPFVVACLHLFEEFVWPGGFKAWYQRYRGADVTSVTTRFLVIINALLLFGCGDAAIAGREPSNLPFWMLMTGILATNGVWHGYATLRRREYSPGIVTGILLYVPLAVLGDITFFREGGFSIPIAVGCIGAGLLYTQWSAVFHGRRRA
jgi:hypothetical protein